MNRNFKEMAAMRMRLASLVLAIVAGASQAVGQPCTSEAYRKVVDDAGAALRRLHVESQPRIQAGFRQLKEKRGWSEDEHLEKAYELLADERSDALDAKAGELLAKLDRLAEDAPTASPDCSRLTELEATAIELQATVRAKTQQLLAKLDGLAGEPPRSAAAEPPPKQSPAPPQPAPAAPASPKAPVSGWKTSTVEDPRPRAATPAPSTTPAPTPGPAPGPPPPRPPTLPSIPETTDAFSADEIREASRGFFGTISTGLGNVIEHAFGQLGRPNAYILGNEGGGAFIAGVRYGKGTLFTRGGKSREVYWHGPSIGYDVGASGSKTLFLVYGLQQELDIFAGFSGVDGSAYLVGGVGMTVLTDGKVVMAPIRSGVGLRLGASIGYIRFTARPTWNPF